MQAFIKAKNIENPTGLWLIHGEEPLIASWLIEEWRIYWKKHDVERKRLDTKSVKTWQEALSEFDNIGLFSSQTVVELHGNHKPDKKTLPKLKAFCEQPNGNCLIVMMPEQDYKAKKTAFFKLCQQMGTVLETTLKNENERKQLLTIKAQEFGISLNAEAWQLLLEQTQHNLLGAYQALWRASDLAVINQENQPDGALIQLDANALKPALVAQSRYNQYDLVEHILLGHVAKVIEILAYLKQSGEAPSLILWNLAKEVRLLQQLLAGANPQDIGIWRNKVSLYQSASRRIAFQDSQAWTGILLEIDKSIKGLSITPVWELIQQLALSMAGKSLFFASYKNQVA